MEKASAAYCQEKAAVSPVGRQYSFDTIVGKSPAIQEAIALARKVAQTDVPVLLTGETGTGKEVFAQSIHQHSSRSGKAFVAINCSSFSRDLLESEMFGHKAGAFTGALKETKGLFEEADNGTIFLDEIGEMAFDLQASFVAYPGNRRVHQDWRYTSGKGQRPCHCRHQPRSFQRDCRGTFPRRFVLPPFRFPDTSAAVTGTVGGYSVACEGVRCGFVGKDGRNPDDFA